MWGDTSWSWHPRCSLGCYLHSSLRRWTVQGTDTFPVWPSKKNIEERQVINYLHKTVDDDDDWATVWWNRKQKRIVIMKVSVRMTLVWMFIRREPVAVNGGGYWHGSGHGVCSPDFITSVNIDFLCCWWRFYCYRRQVTCLLSRVRGREDVLSRAV